VPSAAVLASGRVLVLRPHRLEIALDGRIQRRIAVRQPLDLARLPDLVRDPAVAVRTPAGVVRLRAVLLQRPGTVVEGGASGPLRLELADSGGAGPARISGTRAALHLRHTTVTALPGPASPSAAVAAGLRYLHASDVTLDDVTLRGLGTAGTAGAGGVAALRTDGDSRMRLADVTLIGGGRGVRVDQPASLDVERLRIHGAHVALAVTGARSARLSGLRVDAATDALVVEGSQDVVVRGASCGRPVTPCGCRTRGGSSSTRWRPAVPFAVRSLVAAPARLWTEPGARRRRPTRGGRPGPHSAVPVRSGCSCWPARSCSRSDGRGGGGRPPRAEPRVIHCRRSTDRDWPSEFRYPTVLIRILFVETR
jgi:hypothetical protein